MFDIAIGVVAVVEHCLLLALLSLSLSLSSLLLLSLFDIAIVNGG